ncbi:MAG: 5-formyltetrahydrofolate cyclo-ligase, partial [Pseudomonadota bacterium]|nr:5-formyltetrahydrofolate cyclo-ligase [Pseudomonadota bacterium]
DQLEKKNIELLREHKYLRDKITTLQLEIKKKSDLEENFNQEIEELNKETQSLVSEIEKWQT